MKKIVSFVLSAIIVSSVFLCGCGADIGSSQNSENTGSDNTYEIAVVTDIGALKDKGFNQGTYEGVEHFAKENNITYRYYQPTKGAFATDDNRLAAMNQAIVGGAKIIVTPGYQQAGAIEAVAKSNPEVKFIFVDGWALGLDNVTAIVYKEQESGYLAGYAAVKEGYTKLGFTGGGGGENPACNRYGYGYVQGIAAAAEEMDVDVSVNFSFKYGTTFQSSEALTEQMKDWYKGGAEVIFSCGGSMFQSVKEAASEFPDAKIIGVDVDQSNESEQVITSAVKGLAQSVELVLQQCYNGEWDEKLADKSQNLGAAEDSTGLPTETWSMQNYTVDEYKEIYGRIKDGTLVPDAATPENANDNTDWLNISDRVTIVFDK